MPWCVRPFFSVFPVFLITGNSGFLLSLLCWPSAAGQGVLVLWYPLCSCWVTLLILNCFDVVFIVALYLSSLSFLYHVCVLCCASE